MKELVGEDAQVVGGKAPLGPSLPPGTPGDKRIRFDPVVTQRPNAKDLTGLAGVPGWNSSGLLPLASTLLLIGVT